MVHSCIKIVFSCVKHSQFRSYQDYQVNMAQKLLICPEGGAGGGGGGWGGVESVRFAYRFHSLHS